MIVLMLRMRRCEPSPRRESPASDQVVDVGRMSRSTHERANKTGLVGPDPFEDRMGKPRKEHPEEESIFANNPFIEGLFEWMDSPEGEKHLEIYNVLSKLLEDVHLDAGERKVIWPDAERLDIEQSVQRIQKLYRNFPRDEIEEFMIDWIDMGYEPENYSPQQFDELDRLTERWVADHLRKAKISKKRTRTRHS
jgi:hypothetical protein